MRFNDINLSPPKKPSVLFNWVLPVFLFGIILAGLLLLGIIYPQIEMYALRHQKTNLDTQLAMLAVNNADYNRLDTEAKERRAMLQEIELFKSEYSTVYNIYEALTAAMPNGMTFSSVDISNGTANITGYAPNTENVWRFGLELEKNKLLSSWRIYEISMQAGESSLWSFNVTVMYDMTNVLEEEADESTAP